MRTTSGTIITTSTTHTGVPLTAKTIVTTSSTVWELSIRLGTTVGLRLTCIAATDSVLGIEIPTTSKEAVWPN